MAFVTFTPTCKTVGLLCGPEDVPMLFRDTENPPENAIFPPAALRVSALASAYTENSSFPYDGGPRRLSGSQVSTEAPKKYITGGVLERCPISLTEPAPRYRETSRQAAPAARPAAIHHTRLTFDFKKNKKKGQLILVKING